jgi:penicillin amidase
VRRVTLYRGVYPVSFDVHPDDRTPLLPARSSTCCWTCRLVDEGDQVVLTKGELTGVQGGTNSLQIHQGAASARLARPPFRVRRMRRWIIGAPAALLVLAAAAIAGAALGGCCADSLPQLDGRIVAPQRRAAAPKCVVRARCRGHPDDPWPDPRRCRLWSWLRRHAQDRFFQMDLSRRLAAGELAALLGESVVGQDRRARLFRLRAVARRGDRRCHAGAAGVARGRTPTASMQGSSSLDVRPWEYLLLRADPERWRAEDSILVVHSMWWFLQYDTLLRDIPRQKIAAAGRAARRGGVAARKPDARPAAAVLRFPLSARRRVGYAELPDAGRASRRQRRRTLRRAGGAVAGAARPAQLSRRIARSRIARESPLPGSNAWAVAGSHARGGAALMAGDMHLGLRVPTTWYRARLQVARGESGSLDLDGVTLPGLGALVAGSNGRVAWSFTNSYGGSWSAVQPVDCDPARNVYFTAEGARRFRVYARRCWLPMTIRW